MDEAESLHQSQGYRKVEVKQRVVDPKTQKSRDYTLKIFTDDHTDTSRMSWILALSVLLGAGIFSLSLLLLI